MGRPKFYEVRKVIAFEHKTLDAIEGWRAKQRPIPNVSEAIRQLVALGLKVKPEKKK